MLQTSWIHLCWRYTFITPQLLFLKVSSHLFKTQSKYHAISGWGVAFLAVIISGNLFAIATGRSMLWACGVFKFSSALIPTPYHTTIFLLSLNKHELVHLPYGFRSLARCWWPGTIHYSQISLEPSQIHSPGNRPQHFYCPSVRLFRLLFTHTHSKANPGTSSFLFWGKPFFDCFPMKPWWSRRLV